MAATQLQINWTGVTLSPEPSGSAINLINVDSVMFDQGGELIDYAGDNSRYPTVIVNNVSRPKCAITMSDIATLMAIPVGGVYTITATQPDAKGATGGAINWSLLHAVKESATNTGQWGQFAGCPGTFRAYSSDGATNPLTIASRS